ncbi:MAG: tRNA preQ1(34) S-adenosylmethionine ribosyltransferase-isomerase QueA [Patescibacteria group bacterium]|nr:tRNA preQ1(34) S-adenosylmethionine ribosyltransferase-isomerase QueA [Patescibacteria group bacterium]
MTEVSEFDYSLPEELIAQIPASPRDYARLFVYLTYNDTIIFDRFLNLNRYLPSNSFLVLNDTKVLPARVALTKETGGKVKILFFADEVILKEKFNYVRGLADRKISVGERIYFDKDHSLRVVSQEEKIFIFRADFSKEIFFKLLDRYGQIPTPLYLRRSPLRHYELQRQYQTTFARQPGSVAAPTASLHFTKRVFNKLSKKGVSHYFITLHVGWGTFAPVTASNLKLKKLHQEYYQIDPLTWEKIRQEKRTKWLVAVGTTVVRALESTLFKRKTPKLSEKTSLFIFPSFSFHLVDGLITNFHLPQSSLMMLVEAFLRYKRAKRNLVYLYQIAIKNKFRFYSFGDAMLIL